MDIRFDFKDIPMVEKQFTQECVTAIDVIGREAVRYAEENGTYNDVTGRLRSSNRYVASEGGLELMNDAPYASHVQSRGYDVLSGAQLYAEQRLKEVFE